MHCHYYYLWSAVVHCLSQPIGDTRSTGGNRNSNFSTDFSIFSLMDFFYRTYAQNDDLMDLYRMRNLAVKSNRRQTEVIRKS